MLVYQRVDVSDFYDVFRRKIYPFREFFRFFVKDVFFLNLPNLLLLDTKNCPGDLFEFSRAEHLGQKGASPEGLWCILSGLEQLQHEKIL